MADRPEAWAATLRKVVALAVSLVITRGELAALELADARDRYLRWFVIAIIAAVLLLAALLAFALWIAALFWDGPRGLALGLLTLLYAAIGVGAFVLIQREIAAAPPLFAQTLAELQKDRASLNARAATRDDTG